MSDEDAFLAAIAAAPADQAPRLVFADWLEERGDPRGAWLRDPLVASWMGVRCENPIPGLVAALGETEEPVPPDVCESPTLQPYGYDRRLFLLDAIEATKTTADPVLPTLQKILDDPKGMLAIRAAEVLAGLGDEAEPVLRRAARHKEPAVRETARRSLEGG